MFYSLQLWSMDFANDWLGVLQDYVHTLTFFTWIADLGLELWHERNFSETLHKYILL